MKSKTNYLIFSILQFLLGIAILIGEVPLFKSAVNIVLIVMTLITIKEIIQAIFIQKQKDKMKLFECLISLIFLIVLLIYEKLSLAIIPVMFGIYTILHGLVKFISYILMKKDRVKNRLPILFLAIFFFCFGTVFLFAPLIHLKYMLRILGIYAILLGSTYLNDYFDQIKPDRFRIFKRKIRIALPAFIDAFIPYSVLNHINHLFNEQEENIVLEEKKNKQMPDLEIFIHVSSKGDGKFGHVDMYFDGEVISYGCYDKYHRIFKNGIGSGVLFITNKEKYIPFCIKHSGKTLFGFGLQLTEKEKRQIRNKIKEVKENIVPWYPSLVVDQKAGKEIHLENYEDYANSLYLATHASFYKFKSGRYQSFFILGTNCVSWIDSMVGPTGIDIFSLNGIITPGTYYEYLNNEFIKNGSKVITKTIYNRLYLEKEEKIKYTLLEHPQHRMCKKAKMWLDTHSVQYIERNILLYPPTEKELTKWIELSGIKVNKFFNTGSLYYRQMHIKEKLKKMTDDEKIKLLSENVSLLKRPIIISQKSVNIGFREKEWNSILEDRIN